jgi:hypothetical protein
MNQPDRALLDAVLELLKVIDIEDLLDHSDAIDEILTERCFSEGEDEYSNNDEEENLETPWERIVKYGM